MSIKPHAPPKVADRPQRKPPERGLAFWTLLPAFTIFAVLMPFLIRKHDAVALTTFAAMELLSILVILGLYDHRLFWWAWRGVGAIVFAGCVIYLVAMLIPGGPRAPRAVQENPIQDALLAMLVFGFPGLWFALFGKLPGQRFNPDAMTPAQLRANREWAGVLVLPPLLDQLLGTGRRPRNELEERAQNLTPPIIIDSDGETLIFRSVADAEGYMEPPEVLNGEYVGFDSTGRPLEIVVDPSRQWTRIRLAEGTPDEHAVRRLLEQYLLRFVDESLIKEARLSTLATMALMYCR